MRVLPRLRADLVIREQPQPDGPVFVVKDPAGGRFFRLREAECFIARQLDGRTTPEAVQQRVRERFSTDLSLEDLDRFVASLRGLGLIEGEGPATAPVPARRRPRGSILYLRFPAFDPDRLLTLLEPKARPFFSAAFVIASALAILAAIGVTILNWNEITRDLMGLWRFDALLLAWVIVLMVTALHEFGHGITCKHFGGEVHEMGFMLIYFQPAFYCNVSDAWLFPEKSRRLWVTFSGAYVEILIWALSTLTWRVVEPQTWVSFAAMVVMATSGIKTIFNMNPLIKLDGYYLLSDGLEIPNLRQRSMAFLKTRFAGLFRRGAPKTAEGTRRERRIFFIYGLLAGIYSCWLLGWVAIGFGRFLIARYEGLGLLIFGGFLMTLLRNPLKRLWTWMGAALRAARARPLWKTPLELLTAGAAVAVLLFLVRMELTVPGEITALPLHNADIEAEIDGFVEEILVNEGDRVAPGDPVARLSNSDLLAELEKTEAEILEKVAALEARLSRARASAEKARARLEYAGKDLERIEALLGEGLVSPQEFERVEEEVAVRRGELEEVEAELGRLDPEPVSVDPDGAHGRHAVGRLDLARAELARLDSQRRHLAGQVERLTIVSPSAGVVTTPQSRLEEMVGRFVEKGDLIAEVHKLRAITAAITVSEKDVGVVRTGQEVVVRVRSYPHRTFQGRVVSIAAAASRPDPSSPLPSAAQMEKSFLVTTEIDNDGLLLKPGMTGHAKIHCGRRRLIDLISRSIAGLLRVEFWSWW